MKLLLVVIVAVVLSMAFTSPAVCEVSVYYVRGSSQNATACPPDASTCQTLQNYVENSGRYLPDILDDVKFSFMPGEHFLSSSFRVVGGANINMRTNTVLAPGDPLDVSVSCKNLSNFYFVGVTNLSMYGMAFHNCGGNEFINPGALQLDTVTNFIVSNVQFFDSFSTDIYSVYSTQIFHVSDALFSGFHAGLFYKSTLTEQPVFQVQAVARKTTESEQERNIILSNCSFIRNSGMSTYMYVLLISGPVGPETFVFLEDLLFKDNNSTIGLSTIGILSDLPKVIIEGLNFTNNNGIPLILSNTTVHVTEENYFIGNHALQGGGIALIDNSFLVLHDHSLLVFQDNHADAVGGALYVSSEDIGLHPIIHPRDCFITVFPLPRSDAEFNNLNISVQFINNSAPNGGNILYGGNIDLCIFFVANSILQYQFGSDLFSKMSIFSYEPQSDVSRFSSFPTRVCFCEQNGVPNCTKIFTSVQGMYPGQSFNISVVTVGQRFGVVNGTVYGQLLTTSELAQASLGSLERSQRVTQLKCATLTYSIRSKNCRETIALTAKDVPVTGVVDVNDDIVSYKYFHQITQTLLTVPIYVNISLQNCSVGFVLSNKTSECICDPTITANHLTCDIDTGTVQRAGDVWVSYWDFTPDENGVIVSQQCPNGYCNKVMQNIHLEYPDVQCNFNRSGILCGGCPPNLSLALGSNQCLSCSNGYIALLIPFAISGVLLVLLIQVLDLTVAVGTINGLLFYANIVKSYESVFFVPGQTNILTVFISWLNLDLGIETCFFNGLDGYIKTWLQFAFPLYLWILAGVIIFLARFKRCAKISTRNAVPVLATVFLLSYHKVFQTIITAFSYESLKFPGNPSLNTWKFDANLPFLGTKHVILFTTSMLFLSVAWLPYTLVLLFYQCLLRVNHKRGCWWVFQLKPFFDANFGPLKDKHLYWVGVLLLARAALVMIFVVSSSALYSSLISVAAVAVFAIYLESFIGHVYKNVILNILEGSFFVNLALLCVATYYAKLTGSSQAPVIYTSISIAFLEFIGIVCYHCYKRALRVYLKCKRVSYVEFNQQPPREPVNVTHTDVIMDECEEIREPLCED